MKERLTGTSELKEIQGEIPVWYIYTVGIAGERFFQGLKRGKLIGTKCSNCNKIFLPPKIYCPECFAELKEYVEVENDGEVYSFTTVYTDVAGNKLVTPETIVLVKFRNIEGGLIQRLDAKNIKIGMKVKVKFDKVSDKNLMGIYFDAK